jgi:hypothetical protein
MSEKISKNLGVGFLVLSSSLFMWGCATNRPSSSAEIQPSNSATLTIAGEHSVKNSQLGSERVFKNANVVMWVPSDAVQVWDGPTSGVYIGETTPPGAFVKDHKIELDIEVVNIPEQLQQMERWSSSNWFYQDHPEVSMIDVQYGKQLRRDIWNPEKSRRLVVSARVTKSTTFEEDVQTAEKMIESIKVVEK